MTSPRKACPVVVRQNSDGLEILAFRHPLAGCQLVKGSIEAGEDAGHAALRELCEESGICDARIDSFIGAIQMVASNQEWHLFLCLTGDLPHEWTHDARDDGGHEFKFFWCAMDRPLSDEWHSDFQQAITFIRRKLLR
ncbi:NUDIX hydrolase [Bradyrhizobium oligotrophicum]|uniref:NUDIX hydrolase n=1 Tax=Bradyrhizobium oligotrophicum TaxID=44255 RepID=UPI003EC0E271